MKKSYLLFFISFLVIPFLSTNGQIFVENFDYPVGDSLTQHGWISHSGTGFPFLVVSGSLSYTGYPSSGIGNSTIVESGSGSRQDVHVDFTSVSSGSIYASFLVNLDSASTNGEYFFHFGENPWTTSFRGRVFARNDGSGNIQFGLSKASTSTVEWTTTTYTFGTTYLLVVKYEIVVDPTGSDDVVKLYVNPNVSGPEPGTSDLTNSDSNTDIAVGGIALRQGSNQLTLTIDGIRVATDWNDVVPVELTSFTADVSQGQVLLNWSTATELNNLGFEIQRSVAGNEFVTVGFVNGHGSTTEAKTYSYIDNNLSSGNYNYRLKQIDYDGSFSYSNEVSVEVTTPLQFELGQNYPNPFNPSTNIKFSLAVDSKVSLKIFNILGQEVATLLNANIAAGINSINFDASKLNSGVYLYRLEATGIDGSNFIKIRKMILTK